MLIYLGEEELDISKTKFRSYSQQAWALKWIEMYGGIGGVHHKNWLLDQLARILNGTKVVLKKAEWSNGNWEYRYSLGEPTKEYNNWVKKIKAKKDYDTGIAP